MIARKKVDSPKPGSHKLDLTGQTFHDLEVLRFDRLDASKNKVWLCRCVCGAEVGVKATVLRQGRKKSCGCRRYPKGSGVYNYSGYGDISGTRFCGIKNNALARGIDFRVTIGELWALSEAQRHTCAMTGLPVSFVDGSASVDRIDPAGCYERSNLQIVHRDVNMMRNKYSLERFVEICRLVASKHPA